MIRLIALFALILAPLVASAGVEEESQQPRDDGAKAGILALENVLEVERDNVPAMLALAKLYTSLETIEARTKAERLITRALKESPEDPESRLAMGDLMWAMQRKDEAEDHYLKVLEQDSTNAQAAHKIGLLAAMEFLKYKDMYHIEPMKGGGVAVWHWDEEAEIVRKKAMRWLSRAIEYNPGFKDPYYHLGLIYLEVGQPRGLLDLSRVLLNRDPDDVDGLLFSGLAQQRLKQEESAADSYNQALQKMTPDQRAMMESIENLVPRDGDRSLPSSDIDSEAFWREQDPLHLTDYNERRMEHYGRVGYANLAFSVPSDGIQGWGTDKGRALIKLGSPRRKSVRRPEIRYVGTSIDADFGGGLPKRSQDPAVGSTLVPLTQHTERWAYEGFSIEFTNWGDGHGGWRFDTKYRGPNYRQDSGLAIFEKSPPRFVDPYRDAKYASANLSVGFRVQDGVRFELSYALPLSRIKAKGDEGFLSLEDGLFLFDQDWSEVYHDVEEHFELGPVADDSIRSTFLLAAREIELEPGEYHLVSEVMDRESGSIGTFREDLTVAHPDTQLGMSDLLLAVRIEALTEFPESRDDLEIRPNPLRIYPRAEPVRIYFEIYNLARNEFGRTAYDVSYRVGWADEDEIDASLFPELFETDDQEGYVVVDVVRRREGVEDPPYINPEGEVTQTPSTSEVVDYRVTYVEPKDKRQLPEQADRQVGETEVTAQYEGDREDDFTYLMIDVSRMPVGVRKLTVTVRDRVGGAQTERTTFFRLVD